MISVIIPTYQEGKSLPGTLDSLLAQTYKDVEIIVVDDASTDDTEARIVPYLSKIIYKKISHSGNQVARNTGIALSRGKYIMICDADARVAPTCLEEMAAVLDANPDVSFAYCSFKWGWKLFQSYDFDLERLKHMNYINMASLVRREDHPGFDVAIRRFQDWDVWLTIALQGKKGFRIPRVLFTAGEHRGGISRWLPSIMHRIPWSKLGIRIGNIERYDYWREYIRKKHGIVGGDSGFRI